MSIFTHIVVGSNDLEKSAVFYDKVLGALGINPFNIPGREEPITSILYGKEKPEFIVTTPKNGEAACYANGGTIGFCAESREAIDQFYAAALANGGSCEGEPGPREAAGPDSYGAYVRDPDGNKICAFMFG